MKKIIIILLAFLTFTSYGQAEFEKVAIKENVETASTSKIVSQQPGTGELNYINATALPISTPTQNALDMKLNISDLPTNLTLYPTTAASDVGGYVKMVTDIHDADYNTVAVDVSTPTITGTAQLVSQRISAPGVLIGQPGVFNITTFGNIKRLSGTGTANFYFEVYHRDAAGTETLICTSSVSDAVSLSTYSEFTASGVWDDGDFIATDRIVIKTYANRIAGGTDPVYQFQFGGTQPVRTLLPVPFSVVDAGYELKANKQNSLAIDGTGTKYPTVDAVSGGTSYKRTIAQIRAFTGTLPNTNFYTTDLGKEGNWYYDASDTTTADNTGTVLVTSDGKRIKRIVSKKIIDPLWFGLKGDNSFDNTSLFNNMLSSLGNGYIYEFKEGIYVFSDYLPVSYKISIKGVGKNVVFKQITNYKTLFNVTVDGCVFDNFETRQTQKSQEINFPYGYGSGITFFRVKSGYANNIRCYDSGDETGVDPESVSGAGIYVSGSDNIKITNCYFYNCAMGINLDDYQNVAIGNPARFTCSYNDIKDSYFEECNFGINYDYGALGGGGDFIPGVIDNCKFVRKVYGKSAIEAKMFACLKPLLITNPQCVGRFDEAIASIFGSYNMQILGGYIDGAYDGVVLFQQPSQAPPRNVSIKGMVITNCENAGIASRGGIDCSIIDCEISGNGTGIVINRFSWNIQLINNNIHDNLFSGINIQEALGCKILGGYITNNSTSVSGTQSGIIVNEPNVNGRITDLEVSNVTFDYSFTTADQNPSTNQIYAIKTIGQYYLTSVKTVPGFVKNNYFGRCLVSDSRTEGNQGLVYRSNGTAGSKLIDFPELLNIKNRKIIAGSGTPESIVSGSVGDIFIREDGSLKNSMYVKTSGTATTTGWTPFTSFTEPTVTDMNNVAGFTLIKTTNSCLNTPVASAYFQGIQFSAASNDLYANQIVYDIQGNCFERQKDNGTWGAWRSRDYSKFTKITSASSSIFSGSRNQIIIQDSPTLLSNPFVVDNATFTGQTKLFKNKGVGGMSIAPTGVTIDGSSAVITLAQNEVMFIICNGSNSYETVYRENISLKANIVSPALTGTPTAPTAAPGTNTTQIATTAFVQGIRPYKVYTALISQSGTSAPTAIVLENTLTGSVVWTRVGTGAYLATLTGAFTTSKTGVFTTLNTPAATFNGAVLRGNWSSVNDCLFQTETDTGQFDGAMQNASVEIRVYN